MNDQKKITAILTVWKRNRLEEQIAALLAQTIPPEKIWIYHCGDFVTIDRALLAKYPNVEYQHNTGNLGYFGRFSLALHAATPFVYIVDDDVIPSSQWLETCMKLCLSHHSIITSAGRIIPLNDYMPEKVRDADHLDRYFIGDGQPSEMNRCSTDTRVDFGCNSWFLKTAWLSHFWAMKPYTFDTGEDIHLSAMCLIKGNIQTLCPKQVDDDVCGNLKRLYGFDHLASWRDADFISKRAMVLKYLIQDCHWVPILWKAQELISRYHQQPSDMDCNPGPKLS